MRLLYGHSDEVAAWVASHVPHMPVGATFGECYAIGVLDRQGALVGGVVYHNYFPAYGNIELSFAATSRKWLTRAIITELLDYAFITAKCQRVTGVTPKHYKAARAFLDQFGFKREGVVRRGFGNDDAIISGLLRSEWEASRFNLRSRPRPAENTARQGNMPEVLVATPL